MTTYSPEAVKAQQEISEYVDTVNIGNDGDDFEVIDIGIKPSPVDQQEAFFAREPDYKNPRDVKQAIIHAWLTHCYDADTAVYWLIAFKLLRSPYRGTAYDVMSRAAISEFPGVALPERVTAPIPSGYANPDLVAALAPARAGGGEA